MEISTVICIVIVAAILVGGHLMSKEMDLRKPAPPPQPPQPPMSDAYHAIMALRDSLSRLQDEYDNNQDADVLVEIGKINVVLANIATTPSGSMCKCGGKKV